MVKMSSITLSHQAALMHTANIASVFSFQTKSHFSFPLGYFTSEMNWHWHSGNYLLSGFTSSSVLHFVGMFSPKTMRIQRLHSDMDIFVQSSHFNIT